MVLETFNGLDVIQMPSGPTFKDIKLTLGSTVAVSTNPWTKQTQVYDWMARWWEAELTLPPMKVLTARPWFAFFASLNGQANCFWLSDPLCSHPQGNPQGTPVVNGTTAGGYSVVSTGWTANAQRLLLPGDYIQVGHRLYLVTNSVSADGSGNATINIQPQFRSSDPDISSSMAIITSGAKGLFRLKDNTASWSAAENKLYGFQFNVVEAL